MKVSLGFALLLGSALSLGCSDDGLSSQTNGAADAGTSSSTGDGQTAPPSTGETGGAPTDDTTSGPPTPTTGTSGTTGSDSTGGTEPTSGTDSSGSDSGSSTGTEPTACEAGCAVEFMCSMAWKTEEDCVTACEDNLVEAGIFSPFCQSAWEMLSACLGTLTCDEYGQWLEPDAFPYPCSDADVALEVECRGQ
ncbi:MAG: hypothetical protein K0V04_24365 [Deltaproteobacteria bacterium]|nr:hypothetical protein [Deltaproteobacteria bacterium]